MDKLCAFFKKYNGIIGIVVFALLAVYAFSMATPAANCISFGGWTGEGPAAAGVPEAAGTGDFYDAIMPINDMIIYLSIAGIVWSVLYATLRNQIRKVYYISNFVWHGVYAVFAIVAGILVIVGASTYQGLYMQLPFETMNAYWSTRGGLTISPNTPIFALGYIEAALIILSAVPVAIVCTKQAIARFGHKKETSEASLPEANQ